MKQRPHIIVVGGGHAGCEAAYAAARLDAQVTLVTMRRDNLGVMSCNPALGGLGKGHLIREVDAMGGLMAVAGDRAGIQYRLLNRSKGPAVQGPRAQMDRDLYRRAVTEIINSHPRIQVVEGTVTDLITRNEAVVGVICDDERRLAADAVILTTGTFLNGIIHVGDEMRQGGRSGESASKRLAARLYDLALPMGRLKTGTPPRLRSSSIDWKRLELQSGDRDPVMLSFDSAAPVVPQIACGITHTNLRAHEIIQVNLQRSAMYSGKIGSVGPRYCPSIEDKIARFADKTSHQIFLEPEGLASDLVYPNGISTSLPTQVQAEFVHAISGLEAAEIVQPGYAIEYDFIDPRALSRSLMLSAIPGLYLAGQINGTTGYEEAAAQGLAAGINAVLAIGDAEPLIFQRTDSYVGVMLDDLTTHGATEPYRMFTSRAEFRLSLRADNADQRLSPLAVELGLLSEHRRAAFLDKMNRIERLGTLLRGTIVGSRLARDLGINVSDDGKKRSLFDLLAIPGAGLDQFDHAFDIGDFDAAERQQVSIDSMYAKYLDRQVAEVEALKNDEHTAIPHDLPFRSVSSLSAELRSKLEIVRPETIAQARRIEGMTPAALNAILLALKRHKARVA